MIEYKQFSHAAHVCKTHIYFPMRTDSIENNI
jgi:hypothetical protein